MAREELIRQAAQGQVVHNDDTMMKILELMRENKRLAAEGTKGRTGMFTTGIVSLCEARRIALFFTGREHAGENLTQVLANRAAELTEGALKKAILHRKNALFYKTKRGARVGDIFMSLIYTAELNGANPFDYLTVLQKHEEELWCRPQDWMPWNYQATLDALGETTAKRS